MTLNSPVRYDPNGFIEMHAVRTVVREGFARWVFRRKWIAALGNRRCFKGTA